MTSERAATLLILVAGAGPQRDQHRRRDPDDAAPLIMVSAELYAADDEWMIAATRGHRDNVAWCEAEIKMKKGAFRRAPSARPTASTSPVRACAGRRRV